MKELSRYIIVEETYRYEDDADKEFHKKLMEKKGFIANLSTNPFLKNNHLVTTYQLRKKDDGVVRL